MRKIINPYSKESGCFGCSPDNVHGLQMQFWEDGDEVICHWTAQEHFVGYGSILHGGIQSAMMDEIACWYIMVKEGTTGVTSGMNIRYRKPCDTTCGSLCIRACLGSRKRNVITVKVSLFDGGGLLCSTGEVSYFTVSEQVARERYHYPGQAAFFEQESGK